MQTLLEQVKESIEHVLRESLSGCVCDADTYGDPRTPKFTSYTELAERITNIAQVHLGTPSGIVELRAGVKSYAVDMDDGKALKIVATAPNTQDNRMKLAIIGHAVVTIRMLQADIEAAKTGENSEDPDQMDIGELETETSEAA